MLFPVYSLRSGEASFDRRGSSTGVWLISGGSFVAAGRRSGGLQRHTSVADSFITPVWLVAVNRHAPEYCCRRCGAVGDTCFYEQSSLYDESLILHIANNFKPHLRRAPFAFSDVSQPPGQLAAGTHAPVWLPRDTPLVSSSLLSHTITIKQALVHPRRIQSRLRHFSSTRFLDSDHYPRALHH